MEDTEGESGELARLTGGASHMVFVKGADTALKDLLLPQSHATPASEEFPNTDMKLRDLEAQLKVCTLLPPVGCVCPLNALGRKFLVVISSHLVACCGCCLSMKAWGRRCFRSLVFAFKPLGPSKCNRPCDALRSALRLPCGVD